LNISSQAGLFKHFLSFLVVLVS
jgi:hypothetical protein